MRCYVTNKKTRKHLVTISLDSRGLWTDEIGNVELYDFKEAKDIARCLNHNYGRRGENSIDAKVRKAGIIL